MLLFSVTIKRKAENGFMIYYEPHYDYEPYQDKNNITQYKKIYREQELLKVPIQGYHVQEYVNEARTK